MTTIEAILALVVWTSIGQRGLMDVVMSIGQVTQVTMNTVFSLGLMPTEWLPSDRVAMTAFHSLMNSRRDCKTMKALSSFSMKDGLVFIGKILMRRSMILKILMRRILILTSSCHSRACSAKAFQPKGYDVLVRFHMYMLC